VILANLQLGDLTFGLLQEALLLAVILLGIYKCIQWTLDLVKAIKELIRNDALKNKAIMSSPIFNQPEGAKVEIISLCVGKVHPSPTQKNDYLWINDLGLAKMFIAGNQVTKLMVYDMGICDDCKKRKVTCPHNDIELVEWMYRTCNWPKTKPFIMVEDLDKRKRLKAIVDRRWGALD